jgi:predicted nucleotidyltransferase
MERSLAAVGLPAIVEVTLQAFLAGVRDRFGPRVAGMRLFGSYARGDATEDSDVDCLVLLDRVDQDDDRAITNLAADLTWQIAGVVVSPMIMSVAEFEAWKASERRTPLEIEREGIPL